VPARYDNDLQPTWITLPGRAPDVKKQCERESAKSAKEDAKNTGFGLLRVALHGYPAISRFPGKIFYRGDAEKKERESHEWHEFTRIRKKR
jgi:hypothetical protein